MKTRLQTQGSLSSNRYRGVWHCLMTIHKEEGPKGFAKGLGPRMLYLCPSAAVTFALYEVFKKAFAKVYGVDPALLAKKPSSSKSSGT